MGAKRWWTLGSVTLLLALPFACGGDAQEPEPAMPAAGAPAPDQELAPPGRTAVGAEMAGTAPASEVGGGQAPQAPAEGAAAPEGGAGAGAEGPSDPPAYRGPAGAAPLSSRPGTLQGRVVHAGGPSAQGTLALQKEPGQRCDHGEGGPVRDPSLLADSEGGLADVVATVRVDGQSLESAGKIVRLSWIDGRWEPYVSIVPVGAEVRAFDPAAGAEAAKTYAEVGRFQLQCPWHPEVDAWIAVVDTPFAALSRAGGKFAIYGLPPGSRELELWHPRLGQKEAAVEIPPDAPAQIEVELGG